MTQRNASAAERIAGTAEELASHAESLQAMMAGFRVADVQAAEVGATPALSTPAAVRRPNGKGARMPLVGAPSGRTA